MIPVLALLTMQAQSPPLLTNGGFENGLVGWTVEGEARGVDKAVALGPGTGSVRQRYNVPGLRVLLFSAKVKSGVPGAKVELRLQCFDARDRLVMDQKASSNPKGEIGIYLKTQGTTTYVLLGIEKGSDAGTAVVDDAALVDYDKDRVERVPRIDLDAAMRPIWKGRWVLHESTLLLSTAGGPPTGRLLFQPTKVLSVRDSTLEKEFVEGRDFAIEGKAIVAVKGSGIPTMSDAELAKGSYPWTSLAGRHVFVTYEHRDAWSGPTAVYQGERLPLTVAKLKKREPLTVVAYGDSITHGLNGSGARDEPPYLPPWPSLFARELGRRCRDSKIRFFNASLSGANSDWAKESAHDAVATLDPDLVLIAFGMNDFWALSPANFRANIESVMATVRARRPKCEFVLVTSMRFDPAYTSEPPYVGNFDGYAKELRKMAGPGVALLDMTAMSEALYRAKSAKDLEADPMHPDDFLARWYAQSLIATVLKG